MADFLFSFNWNVDARLKKEFAQKSIAQFDPISTPHGIATFIDNPADSYTKGLASMICLRLNDVERSELIDYSQLNACNITNVHLVAGFSGFLTIEVFGEVCNAELFRNDIITLANRLPECHGLISTYVELMGTYLSSREDFSFGQPLLLCEQQLCDSSESYIYTTHIFSADNAEIKHLQQLYHIPDTPLSVDGGNVWQRFGKQLWLLPQTPNIETMHRLSFANILAMWEVLIYDTGAINYKNFLRLIIDKQEFDHNVMRDAINRDNLLLQEVSIATRELTTEQNDFTVQSRLQFGTAMRKDAFDKGQKMLCYAIEGIDSSKQSKSNKAVEIILTILTAMSVYSVVNDGFTLMTNKEEEFTFHFLSSFLFTLATAVMLVILFIVIRKRD